MRRLDLPDADISLWPAFLGEHEATALLRELLGAIPWRRDTITVFGRTHPIPRLHQWFADDGRAYTWSGLTMEPAPWPDGLLRIRARLLAHTGVDFDGCLANLYRDGQDAMGWHADDEPELGPEPVIASVSLGASRDFQLRHRTRKDLPTTTITLPHGSLLVMEGPTQAHWKHQLPRRMRVVEPRINLTFRRMFEG